MLSKAEKLAIVDNTIKQIEAGIYDRVVSKRIADASKDMEQAKKLQESAEELEKRLDVARELRKEVEGEPENG